MKWLCCSVGIMECELTPISQTDHWLRSAGLHCGFDLEHADLFPCLIFYLKPINNKRLSKRYPLWSVTSSREIQVISSSEPVAACSNCRRLGNALFLCLATALASLTRPSCVGALEGGGFKFKFFYFLIIGIARIGNTRNASSVAEL